MTAKSWRLASDEDQGCEADIVRDGSIERVTAKTAVVCSGGHQANLTGCAKVLAPPPTVFMIRGTPYVTGSVLRLLLDAGARPVGDPTRCHMVAVEPEDQSSDGGSSPASPRYHGMSSTANSNHVAARGIATGLAPASSSRRNTEPVT